MPELNFDNPAVRQEMVDIAATYLSMGVDGFRFDAAKDVYYGEEQKNAEKARTSLYPTEAAI